MAQSTKYLLMEHQQKYSDFHKLDSSSFEQKSDIGDFHLIDFTVGSRNSSQVN